MASRLMGPGGVTGAGVYGPVIIVGTCDCTDVQPRREGACCGSQNGGSDEADWWPDGIRLDVVRCRAAPVTPAAGDQQPDSAAPVPVRSTVGELQSMVVKGTG